MTAPAIQDFFQAIRSCDENAIVSMVEADPALLQAKNEHGAGAFVAAKYARQERIASLLLEEMSRRGVALDIFEACIAGDERRLASLLAADRALA